jgi:shikimate kinase
MMQRRDFEAVAGVLARARLSASSAEIEALVADMADTLAATNPSFNRARFLAACSYEAGLRHG